MNLKTRDPYLLAALGLTLAHAVLIWAFRFLPLYDYPMWLYEVHIMRNISDPIYAKFFEIVYLPIPNLAAVGLLYVLGSVLPLEIAGKIFLTACVAGLPWSFWYCVRSVNNGKHSWAEFVGFPFSFCLYFFGGQGFFFGLSCFFLTVGFFQKGWESLTMRVSLAFALLVAYFIHAIILLLLLAALIGCAMRSGRVLHRLRVLAFASLPVLCCAVAYVLVSFHHDAEIRWSFWSLGQSVFKPIFLFTRSYGHSNPLPLTLLNVIWLVILTYVGANAYRVAFRQSLLHNQFFFPIAVCLLLMLLLPAELFGVKIPGARFGLPLVLLFILMTSQAQTPEFVKPMFLIVASSVLTYNAFHFQRVDERMQMLYTDLESAIDSSGTFEVVRFDWPAERDVTNVGASSVDPLFGAMYYLALERQNVGAIFETALLRYRPGAEISRPLSAGQSRQEFTASMVAQRNRFLRFRYLVLVGKNQELERFANAMAEIGFEEGKKGEFWTILKAPHTMYAKERK